MKKPVWYSRAKGDPRAEFVAFSAGRDVVPILEADSVLIPYDLWTNRSHAVGLREIGVYTGAECKKVLQALHQLEREWENGSWKLDPQLEDVHINIESRVAEICGEEISGRLHSGRSRNDQVACDMKLYARDVILGFMTESMELIHSLLEHAGNHADTVMPGYTHHRKATITSWGHWCASYAQGLLRDMQRFADLYKRINACPLGAAAAYGTTWPLDRKLTAKLLAFDGVQENTLDAVSSRGEAEAEIVQCLACLMKRLACFSQDIILFSTEEFGYLALPSDFTTGSSIMPQKRNPDFAEAIKGKSHVIAGLAQALISIDGANLSGYNKDVQWSKYLFLDAVREAGGAATILANVVMSMTVHADRMEQAARSGFLNAVDVADYLARSRRLPFRKTYTLMSEAVGASTKNYFQFQELNQVLVDHHAALLSSSEFEKLNDPMKCLLSRSHIGSPNPKQVRRQIQAMKRKSETFQKWIQKQQDFIQSAQKRCRRALEIEGKQTSRP
ncbi:MAG: argininosuccinate lyase [Candidatus Omnitrophica bacterium]|nr:argininosuccinate lyase [Candidatus Omnitrophota bacterium]